MSESQQNCGELSGEAYCFHRLRLNQDLAAMLAEESILLSQFLARLQQALGRRSRFTDQSDLAQKLADLFMVTRAYRCVRTAGIADIDAKVLHGGFHHRREAVGSPFSG